MISAADSIKADVASNYKVPIGDELPIFCEACGYALHGLAPVRCDHCAILQFHCPECGHHQPVNTLRPAAQRILARARANILAAAVTLRLCFFGLSLFGWFISGGEASYTYRGPFHWTFENVMPFVIFGVLFGLVARMLLLRWRGGFLVATVLATLVMAAMSLGAAFHKWDLEVVDAHFTAQFFGLLLITGTCIFIGAAVAWPAWVAVVRLFIAPTSAEALLAWQSGQSDQPIVVLARQ